jgi:hypothetical protein
LLRKGVTAIAATRMRASAPEGGSTVAAPDSQAAMRSVAPVVCMASLTGIRAPMRIKSGHSMTS